MRNYRSTKLLVAAEEGKAEVVKRLLDAGADVNQADTSGRTPLMFASLNGHMAVAEMLLERGADVNQAMVDVWSPLYIAAEKGHTNVMRLLLAQEGIEVNQAKIIGWTPLYVAAYEGHKNVVALLLAAGADINQANMNGSAPLDIAVQNGHMAVAEMLLERGADVNQADRSGWTPLLIAAHKGHTNVAKLLLDSGADVNQANNDGWTALMVAARTKSISCLAVLLAAKYLVIGATNNEGKNALFALSVLRQRGFGCQRAFDASKVLARSLFELKGNPGNDRAFKQVALESLKSPACMCFLLSLLEPTTIWEEIVGNILKTSSEEALIMLFFKVFSEFKEAPIEAAEGKEEAPVEAAEGKEEAPVVRESTASILQAMATKIEEIVPGLGKACRVLLHSAGGLESNIYSRLLALRDKNLGIWGTGSNSVADVLKEALKQRNKDCGIMLSRGIELSSDPLYIVASFLGDADSAKWMFTTRIEAQPGAQAQEEDSQRFSLQQSQAP